MYYEYVAKNIVEQYGALSLLTADNWIAILGLAVALVSLVFGIANNYKSREHERELQAHKSSLERGLYVTKTRFDVEFAIYRELIKSFWDVINDIRAIYGSTKLTRIISNNPDVAKNIKKDAFNSCMKNYGTAEVALSGNLPFIDKDISFKFLEILFLVGELALTYEKKYYDIQNDTVKHDDGYELEKSQLIELNTKWEELSAYIRDHISSMKIVE